MAGLIPESFIEELLSRTDIVELIGRHVSLKSAGREFKACCPFHEEKTASFTVSPQKQFYHCFGCGAHGSAIGFLMNHEGLEFPDAVEELARSAGLTVPRDASAERQHASEDLYTVLEAASRFYQEQLRKHPEAAEYLKRRGLTGEIAAEFNIGFAPGSWHELTQRLGQKREQLELLKRAGLISEGQKGPYDKFRKRIMFPIQDRRGRVIAFGGRTIDDDGPKYLNSPETELFHKGRELYGLYLARRSQSRLDQILVVEGYLDVVALAQFGFRSSVATLGTAISGDQAELVLRAAGEVVYCFDGDRAGRQAAWRAVESTLPRLREGRQARFLFLPEGEDPDSMVRKHGADRFAALIASAQPLSGFFFDHFTAMVDLDSIDGRARLVELARPEIHKMPEGVFRDMMLAELEKLAQHRMKPGRPAPPARRPQRDPGALAHQRTPLRLAMAHLIQNPRLVSQVQKEQLLPGCDLQGMEIFREVVDFCTRHPNLSTAQLLELWRDHPAQPHLRTLATWPLHGEPDRLAQEFRDALTSLELQWTEALIDRMPTRITEQSAEQRKQLLELQQRCEQLKDQRAGLSG